LIEVLVALALLGIFAGGDGLIGAGWLLGGAALVPWVFYPLRDLTRRYGLARVFWLPLVWGGLLVITGGLTSQVSYTVLAAAGIAAGLWVYHSPE
jgi:prepilin-type N-terminal cleavage/methylation domain-containing protein